MDEDEQAADAAPVGAAKWTAKHDATTKAAMDIIERERAERDAKTARLRAARLAQEEQANAGWRFMPRLKQTTAADAADARGQTRSEVG